MSLEDAPASVAGEKRTNIFAGLTREPMEVEEYAAIAPPEARGLTLAWNAMLADMQPLWAISQWWPPFVDAWRQGLVDELGNVNDLEDIDVYCQVACGPQGFVDDGVPVLWGELPEGAKLLWRQHFARPYAK